MSQVGHFLFVADGEGRLDAQ